jgi:hypothetical protein
MAAALAVPEARPRMEKMHLPCCGETEVLRLKELPHLYGTDFDLFRCNRCSKAWVAYWVTVASSGDWIAVTEPDVEKMMLLEGSDLKLFMREWAKDFD